jgi:uncharacterized membrane protein
MAVSSCGQMFADSIGPGGSLVADKQVVLAIFKDEPAADAAVESLKEWNKDNNLDIELGSIGVLVLGDDGKVKTHKLGARSGATGAGIGLVLAVIAPPTLLAGIIGGGILGHFHHKGLGLTTEDRDRITAELGSGKAAVGVLVADVAADEISAKLTSLGGTAEVHTVSAENAAEIDAVAPSVEAAEAAAPEEAAHPA